MVAVPLRMQSYIDQQWALYMAINRHEISCSIIRQEMLEIHNFWYIGVSTLSCGVGPTSCEKVNTLMYKKKCTSIFILIRPITLCKNLQKFIRSQQGFLHSYISLPDLVLQVVVSTLAPILSLGSRSIRIKPN